jgi:hypothetical protein
MPRTALIRRHPEAPRGALRRHLDPLLQLIPDLTAEPETERDGAHAAQHL